SISGGGGYHPEWTDTPDPVIATVGDINISCRVCCDTVRVAKCSRRRRSAVSRKSDGPVACKCYDRAVCFDLAYALIRLIEDVEISAPVESEADGRSERRVCAGPAVIQGSGLAVPDDRCHGSSGVQFPNPVIIRVADIQVS